MQHRRLGRVPRLHDGSQQLNFARQIGAALRQAREVWRAAVESPPLSQPILFMYAAEHLAQALILSTYKAKIAHSHGLEWLRTNGNSDAVHVLQTGLFQQMHDAYSHS